MLPTLSSLSVVHAARHALAVLCVVAGLLFVPAPAPALTLPPGFQQDTAIGGLADPMDVEIAAGGRVFVAEKSGVIKTYDDLSDPTATTFADLRAQVHNFSNRGLLGLAIDPSFSTNPYVYVYYTLDAPIGGTPPTFGAARQTQDKCPGDPDTVNCVVSARVSRLRVDGERMNGPEQVLVEDWCQQFPFHTGGGIEFGADGYLYVSGGDGARWGIWDYGQLGDPANPCDDPPGGIGALMTPPTAEGGRLRAQDLRTGGDPLGLGGSLIRIDPATGAGVPGTPMFTSAEPNARRMLAHGFRNPARLAIRPQSNDVWVADRGGGYWEELDRVQGGTDPVRNFGWPCYEGGLDANGVPYSRIRPRSNDQDLDICENLYAEGNATAAPYWAYDHERPVVEGEDCETDPVSGKPLGNQISGLNFYPAGGSFPAAYRNALFFADRLRNCMYAMLPGPDGLPRRGGVVAFAQGAERAIDIEVAPNGDLLYVDQAAGAVRRIAWTGNSSNQAPSAVMQADTLSGGSPLTVTFDSNGSSDPDPGDLLIHEWDLDGDGDFDDWTEPSASHTYVEAGAHTVTLRVTDTSGASSIDTLTIHVSEPAELAELMFSPIADARVDEASPSTNFATSSKLQATGSIPSRESYLRFELAGIAGRVVSAKLRLTSTTDGTKDGPALYGAGSGWTETGLAWDNRPPRDPLPVDDVAAIPKGTVAEYEAKALVNGNGSLDLALVSTFNDNVDFGSRDFTEPDKRPQLVVTFEASATDTEAPASPGSLAAQATSHDRVDLSWSPATDNVGVIGYEIYRDGRLLATRGTATSWSDTTVTPQTSYEYTVRALDAAGNRSAASNTAAVTTPAIPDTQAPSPPGALTAAASRHDRVDLGWGPATDNLGVTGYEVLRDGQVIATVEPVTAYTDATVAPQTSYEYTVRALDAAENRSAPSNTAGVTVPAAPDTQAPSAPADLAAQAVTGERVNLTWSAATDDVGVTGYEIHRDGELVATTGDVTSYADMAVAEHTTYAYTVRALDAAGNRSPASNTADVTTPAASPTTLVFAPVADALVDEASPAANFGTSDTLQAKGNGKKRESYLRFELAGITGPVAGAKLRLAPAADGTNDGPGLYGAGSAWTETGITWSNRPPRSAQAADDVAAIPLGAVAEYDARALVDGNGTVDMALVTSTSDSVDFGSREFTDAARRPRLVVTFYAASPDTQAPSAPGGLTAHAPSHDRVDLGWTAATDNAGVTGYEVLRDGWVIATLGPVTSYVDAAVGPQTTYEYTVRALDAAGNRSPAGNTARVTTPAPVTSSTVTFNVAADAHVDEGAPTRNFGTASRLEVVGGNRRLETYLRFSLIGITGTVQAAKLRVYAFNDATSDGPAVHGAGSSWAESGITWSNRPSRTATAAANAGAIAARSWVEYDVLPLVTGNGDVTFALVGDSSDSVNFLSRENSDSSTRAQLVVTFAG